MPSKDTPKAVVEPVSAYERAILFGDVAKLSERERLEYLKELASSVGLSPISRPFGYLPVRDSLTVYLTATGAAQLRRIHNISITEIVDEGIVNGFYRVKVYGRMPNGRVDVEYGSVACTFADGAMHRPQELENDRKKVLTQAKTRLTKSMVGLSGVLAEEEIEDIPEQDRGVPEQSRQLTPGNGTATNTEAGEITTLATPEQHERYGELWARLGALTGTEPPHLPADAPRERANKAIAWAEREIAKHAPTDEESPFPPTGLPAVRSAEEAMNTPL
jgi:hypothetical protein